MNVKRIPEGDIDYSIKTDAQSRTATEWLRSYEWCKWTLETDEHYILYCVHFISEDESPPAGGLFLIYDKNTGKLSYQDVITENDPMYEVVGDDLTQEMLNMYNNVMSKESIGKDLEGLMDI